MELRRRGPGCRRGPRTPRWCSSRSTAAARSTGTAPRCRDHGDQLRQGQGHRRAHRRRREREGSSCPDPCGPGAPCGAPGPGGVLSARPPRAGERTRRRPRQAARAAPAPAGSARRGRRRPRRPAPAPPHRRCRPAAAGWSPGAAWSAPTCSSAHSSATGRPASRTKPTRGSTPEQHPDGRPGGDRRGDRTKPTALGDRRGEQDGPDGGTRAAAQAGSRAAPAIPARAVMPAISGPPRPGRPRSSRYRVEPGGHRVEDAHADEEHDGQADQQPVPDEPSTGRGRRGGGDGPGGHPADQDDEDRGDHRHRHRLGPEQPGQPDRVDHRAAHQGGDQDAHELRGARRRDGRGARGRGDVPGTARQARGRAQHQRLAGRDQQLAGQHDGVGVGPRRRGPPPRRRSTPAPATRAGTSLRSSHRPAGTASRTKTSGFSRGGRLAIAPVPTPRARADSISAPARRSARGTCVAAGTARRKPRRGRVPRCRRPGGWLCLVQSSRAPRRCGGALGVTDPATRGDSVRPTAATSPR